MARTFNSIQANTLADLTTAINAYLAGLIGGAATKIMRMDIVQIQMERYLGKEFVCFITTNSTGAAALAAPYVFASFEYASDTDLETAVATYLTTHAADFVAGVRNISAALPSNLKKVCGWTVSSTDAANAATNWSNV